MSGNGFVIADDGWVQVTPCGEFPHAGAGVTQVVDREACDGIAAEFVGRKADANFPGVLVDFDHFSLDTDKSSEAAGWITELEARDTGLWARVRWSDAGLAAVQGGRFRLVSPVFPAPAECQDLGDGKIRPLKLVSVALTNEPNIRGARPIANRKTEVGDRRTEIRGQRSEAGGEAPDSATTNREGSRGGAEARRGKDKHRGDVMSGPGTKRFVWLLGETKTGKHCPVCLERNGQVKTLLEWLKAGPPPCSCKCQLAEDGEQRSENGGEAPDGATTNREERSTFNWRSGSEAGLENRWKYPWGDKARAASLAVRRAKAAARHAAAAAGSYQDGQPVIRDLTDLPEPSAGTSISDGTPFEELQRRSEEAFRQWRDGVEATSDSIGRFNEFVGAFGGMAAAAAGSASPAGAASRVFGVGGARTGQPLARRGLLSRFRDPPNPPDADEAAVIAVERAKSEFAARRAAERSELADAIRRIDPGAAGLESLSATHLREYLRRIGGDPGKAALPDTSGSGSFAALKEKYGVPASKLVAPEKYAAKETPAEIREGMAEYLMEAVGHRPGSADQNLRDLEAQSAAAARGLARAKETALRTQREASFARSQFGDGSPEYGKAVKAADGAAWELRHASRASERISAEYRALKRNINSFLERAREGNPIDWGPGDADYNALLEAARRASPLRNRWKYGWGDAARAASLAVRRAKAALRAEAERWKNPGQQYQGGDGKEEANSPGPKAGTCRICGKEGHWAKECPERHTSVTKPEPYRNGDGDLVVDGTLTILKGTPPEKVAEILRRHSAGGFVDRAIETDQRLRAYASRMAAENEEAYGGTTRAQRDRAWRETLQPWMEGGSREESVRVLKSLGARQPKRRKGTAGMTNRLVKGGAAVNRWSDAARAAAHASRKASGNYAGWSDAARAAALAVRREKAAARAASYGGTSYGGAYEDGQPVIRDLTDIGQGYAGGATISDADPVEARQRKYEEAFRQWWDGVETSAGNIEKFHAYVAAFGGAAAAAAGAYSPAGAASGAFGAKYGGQKPVYDQSGNVVGWARVGGRPAAARRGTRRETVTADPLNDPKTPGDFAVREAYERHLEYLRRSQEAEMAAKGLDPQGYPASPLSAAESEALALFRRLSGAVPRSAVEDDAYHAAAEGLSRFTDLYERDMLERADREGILAGVREALDSIGRQPGGVSESEDPGDIPYFETPGGVREPAAGYGTVPERAARDAARALGVLHGAYGVGEDGVAIPDALLADYEAGRAEGAKGYDYGVVPPKDRAAVLRGAQAYLDGAVGEDDGYAPDHLNDRYNLADWDGAASWATRNQGKGAVYDPRTPDTRGQYSPAGLMGTAMAWFKDAMARGDRGESNAALSYMGDLLSTVAADRRTAAEASRGGGEDTVEEGEEPEIDAAMPEFDGDGNEVGGEPFFEDSYADPNARQPWENAEEAFRQILRKAGRQSVRNRLANRWTDAARAASLAARRARKERNRRRIQEEADARRESGAAPLSERASEPGLKEAAAERELNGLRRKFAEAAGRVDRDRLKDAPVTLKARAPAAGFKVPVKDPVYYCNGSFYDRNGKWLSKAAPAPKSGPVFRNGMWYDAATGRTLGRSLAAS